MDKPLNCTIKSPVNLALGEIKMDMSFGCKVIDITFPNIMNPEVGEIRFKNYYVASLTIKVRYRATDHSAKESGSDQLWRMGLKKFKLMPDPHCEEGSHDYFTFSRKHFRCELSNVAALRLILQQPSPVWKEFKLEDLRIFRFSGNPKINTLPGWLMEEPKEKVQKKVLEGVPDLEELSSSLQQLWALAEEAASNQTSQSLGRFEVDGCYDINLLSYT